MKPCMKPCMKSRMKPCMKPCMKPSMKPCMKPSMKPCMKPCMHENRKEAFPGRERERERFGLFIAKKANERERESERVKDRHETLHERDKEGRPDFKSIPCGGGWIRACERLRWEGVRRRAPDLSIYSLSKKNIFSEYIFSE